MSLDTIFWGCQTLAIIGWLALAISPVNRVYCIGFARGVALVLAVAYLAQLFVTTQSVEGGNFNSLGGITKLFSLPSNVMLGWTHYLVFDLFIGSWETEDAAKRGVPHWLLLPCLFLTLMFGPLGLLLYFIIRTIRARTQPAAA